MVYPIYVLDSLKKIAGKFKQVRKTMLDYHLKNLIQMKRSKHSVSASSTIKKNGY
jgi:hypothetical protein